MSIHVRLFFMAFGLWLLLTGSLAAAEVMAGFLVATAVAVLAAERARLLEGLILSPAAAIALLRYLGSFLRALVAANADMARRVLSPSLPLRPALVRVETGLESDLGRLVLANSITLTPGTLTVDVEGNQLLVHWVDCPPNSDLPAITQAIAGDFERHLKGFLR